jgi:hypothetical protein
VSHVSLPSKSTLKLMNPKLDLAPLGPLQHAAAVACGVLAALTVHIALTVAGFGLGAVMRDNPSNTQQLISALAWWAIGATGFITGWATGLYLIVAARGRAFIDLWARRLLIALALVVCTAAGIMSKTGGLSGGADVLTSLAALALGLLSAFCGARLAYLRSPAPDGRSDATD